MLTVVSLGIFALTLNWFDVATAFPLIGAEFAVGLGPLSYLISLYIVGYGLAHIPGGMLATAIGMKKTLVLGLAVQGLAGIMSGLSYNYTELAFFRVLSGIGGSVFIAVGTAAVVVWFGEKDVTLALGITGGAVFSAGAAVTLYGWLYVQRATSWHTSLILAGVFELVVMVVTLAAFDVPSGSRSLGSRSLGSRSLGGARFDRAALRVTLASRDLWIYGLALFGGYGAYFTTSQLFSEYVTLQRHFDPAAGGATGLMLMLAAVGGFFIPIVFGHLVSRTSFDTGWAFLAAVSFTFALIGLAGRNPGAVR
jgi:MFS family permease